MNSPSMNQWNTEMTGTNSDPSACGNSGSPGAPTATAYTGELAMGGQCLSNGQNKNMNLIDVSNMNIFTNFNGNSSTFVHGVSSGNVSTSIPLQGGQININLNPPNDNSSAAAPIGTMPTSGILYGSGFPQSTDNMMLQVKTGESMTPLIKTVNMGQQPQPQPQGGPLMPYPNTKCGNKGGNNTSAEIARSSSEPMLNTMMLEEMKGNNVDLFGLNSGQTNRSLFSSMGLTGKQMHSNIVTEQLEKKLSASNDVLSGDSNLNNRTGDSNINIGTSSSSGAAGGGGGNRRHSEPAPNFMDDIFDESTIIGASPNANSNNIDVGSAGLEYNHIMYTSGEGWSSPVPHVTELDRSLTGMASSRQRSSSEPLNSTEGMMLGLHKLKVEKASHEYTMGVSSPRDEQLQRNEQPSTHWVMARHNDNSNAINSRNITGEVSKVKRSRSMDPLGMFRRGDRDDSFGGPLTQSDHGPEGDNDGYGDIHKGLSDEDQQMLQSMGIYPREKPKRRRSDPLLSQDLFQDLHNHPDADTGGKDESQKNIPSSWSFKQGPSPSAPQEGRTNQPSKNAPQESQSKNNINLIQMLLGIEDGMIDSQTDNSNSGDRFSGMSQVIHQQLPKPAYELNSMAPALEIENMQEGNSGGTSLVMHHQLPKPTHEVKSMASNSGTENAPGRYSGGTSQVINQHTLTQPQEFHLMTTVPQSQHLPTNNGPSTTASTRQQQQLPPDNNWSLKTTPIFQQKLPANCSPASTSFPQQQTPSSNRSFMSNPNASSNQMPFHAQQHGNAFVATATTNNLPQAPPPLSINNSEDLTLVLSAVKETQTNLQTLQPMVMQLGDPIAMEEIASAFKLTASSSQFVLASDLPSAYASLNDAWVKIKKLEDQLAQGPQQQFLSMDNMNPISAGIMGQMILPAQIQAMANNTMLTGILNPPQALSPGNSCIHISQANQKKVKESGLGHQPTKLIPPTNGLKPRLDIEQVKSSSSSLKSKPRTSRKKMSSPPPSPVEDVVEFEDLPSQNKDDPEIIMKRLRGLMERTQMSQKQLQKWDKKNGLPKSHSQTMVNSGRSRQQLQKGIILKKWNGDPLISSEVKSETDKSDKSNSTQEGLGQTGLSRDQPVQNNSPQGQPEELPIDHEVNDVCDQSGVFQEGCSSIRTE